MVTGALILYATSEDKKLKSIPFNDMLKFMRDHPEENGKAGPVNSPAVDPGVIMPPP